MIDLSLISSLPDQSLTDAQIEKKYGSLRQFYQYSALYYAQYMNRTVNVGIDKTQASSYASEAEEIRDNFDYARGVQRNSTFAYLQQYLDDTGAVKELATPFMAGQDISTIMLFRQGQFLNVASGAEPTVKVLNEEMKNEVTRQIKMVEVARKFKRQIEQMQEATGIEFQSPANPESSTDEVLKTIYRSFATGLQSDANKMLDYVRQYSMRPSDLLRAYTNCDVGRRACLEVTEDGMVEIIEPWAYRSVSGKDDDFGRYDLARMRLNYISKDDVFAKYDKWLTKNEKDTIRKMSFMSQPWFFDLANYFNYSLLGDNNQFLSELKVYWRSTLDTGYRIVSDSEDGRRVLRIKKGSKKRGEPTEVIRYATILANTFVASHGIYDVIDDPINQGGKLFPIMHFQPNTHMGSGRSSVDRMKNVQKELDAIDSRVRENYTMDLGTILAVNGKKFKNGITPDKMYGQLRRTRMTIATSSGEPGDPTDKEPIIERQDVSLMRDIENYLRLYSTKQDLIKSIANVSPAIMGTPTQYIGLKTQQNSAALASNSVQYSISGTIQLFADAAALAIERVKRQVQEDPDNPKWQNLFGEDGVQRILDLKNDPYTQFLLSVSVTDVITPEERARVTAMIEQLAATGAVDMVDWIKSLRAKTYSELLDFAEYSVGKKQYREQVQMMMMNASNDERTRTMAEGQAMAKGIEQQGQLQKQQQADKTSFGKEMLKQGYPIEDIGAVMAGADQGGGQEMPYPPG